MKSTEWRIFTQTGVRTETQRTTGKIKGERTVRGRQRSKQTRGEEENKEKPKTSKTNTRNFTQLLYNLLSE